MRDGVGNGCNAKHSSRSPKFWGKGYKSRVVSRTARLGGKITKLSRGLKGVGRENDAPN